MKCSVHLSRDLLKLLTRSQGCFYDAFMSLFVSIQAKGNVEPEDNKQKKVPLVALFEDLLCISLVLEEVVSSCGASAQETLGDLAPSADHLIEKKVDLWLYRCYSK